MEHQAYIKFKRIMQTLQRRQREILRIFDRKLTEQSLAKQRAILNSTNGQRKKE